MSFLRADDEEWMREPPPARPQAPGRCYERRSKVTRLDDLVIENDKEKRQRQQRKKKGQSDSSNEDDEDDDSGEDTEKKLADLIQKCSNEMGDETSMQAAPEWGEQVFGLQKEFPSFRLEPESMKLITDAADSLASRTSLFSEANESAGEELLLDILCGNWMLPLSLRGKLPSDLLQYIFNQVAFSSNRNVQRSGFSLLSDYARKQRGEQSWRPDFVEVLRCYGYLDSAQDLGQDATESSGPPPNFDYVLKFLAALTQSRLLQNSDAEKYVFVLARCLLDRKLLPFSLEIQDCITLLIDYFPYFPEEQCSIHLSSIAKSIARISDKLVNVLYVARKLRGARNRIQRLRREIAFELLLILDNKLHRREPKQVISSLQGYDPKADVDFIRLYYHIDIVDMMLRYDPSFKSDAEALSSWMSVLRGFSVRIFCGDYRTFANKVRNRAAFLVSIYSQEKSL